MQLNEDQRMIQDMVRAFTAAELKPLAAQVDKQARFDPGVLQKLAAVNLLGLLAPADAGGAEVDYATFTLAVEEVARVCGSTALLLVSHNSLGAAAIAMHGSAALRAQWVGRCARGEAIAAFAWTEPDAGSDSGVLQTTAELQGENWVLNGAKTAVSCASVADCFVVAARETGAGADRSNLGLWLVDKSAPGLTVDPHADTLGLRAAGLAWLQLEQVVVGPDNRLEVRRMDELQRLLDGGRIAIAALAVGIAAGGLERALRYARERPQFLTSIVEHQSVQLRLADAAADTHAARLVVHEAARAYDAHEPVARLAATAKLFATEAATRVCDHAIQVHGGYGYCTEYHVERSYRDAKMCEVAYGPSDLQRFVIVREMVREADAGWALLQ